MKNETIIKAWEMIDLTEYLKRWLEAPYGFPDMEDRERAAEELGWIEDFFRSAVHHFGDGTEAELQRQLKEWNDDADLMTLEETVQDIEKIFDNYEEWQLTEEAYLERLEEDQNDAGRLRDDFGVVKVGIKSIKEAI